MEEKRNCNESGWGGRMRVKKAKGWGRAGSHKKYQKLPNVFPAGRGWRGGCMAII